MKTEVEHRAGYKTMAIGMDIPDVGCPVAAGQSVAAVILCREQDPGSCVVGVLDTLSNETQPLAQAMPEVMQFVRKRAVEARIPPPRAWYAIDAHGRVEHFTASGKSGRPVAVQGWPVATVEAMVRHHQLGNVMWMELARFVETHFSGVIDASHPAIIEAGRWFERKEIALAGSYPQTYASAALGATVIEAQALAGATIIGVSMDQRTVAVKRDLVLDTRMPADLISVANYVPSCYGQTEVFVRRGDGVWRKRGGLDDQTLLIGARLYAPATWRLG